MMPNMLRLAGRASAVASRRFTAAAVQGRRGMATFFTKEHEYIRVEGDIGTVGITDYAQNELGDIVYVELPDIDTEFSAGDEFGTVESVKAASEVYVPVSGTVTEANDGLEGNWKLVNESPEEDGWFIKLKVADPSELDALLTEDAYKAHCEDLDH